MVSIWWKIWFSYGLKPSPEEDMNFDMVLLWCGHASSLHILIELFKICIYIILHKFKLLLNLLKKKELQI